MKQLRIYAIVGMALWGAFLCGCDFEEDGIRPQGIDEKYRVPQGEHGFDTLIVNFYQKTGTFILYRYDSLDAIWNVTGLYPNTRYPLRITLPKEENLEKGVSLIFKHWLGLYPEEVLKSTLPKKILLADTIWQKRTMTDVGKLTNYSYTIDNICIGNINESLTNLSKAKEKEFKAMLNNAYIQYCIEYYKMEVPKAFYAGLDYSKVTPNNAQSDFGIVQQTYNMGPKEDMLGFINLIFTEDQFMIDHFWFDTDPVWGVDVNGLIKKKCGILVDEMKRIYNIDLEALSGLKLK